VPELCKKHFSFEKAVVDLRTSTVTIGSSKSGI